MDSGIFDMLVDRVINERLDSIVLSNEEYKQAQRDIGAVTKEVEAHGFSADELKLIDRLVCAYTAEGALSVKLSYAQGFKDCVLFLKEIGVIKTE